MKKLLTTIAVVLITVQISLGQISDAEKPPARTGILLLAHGGKANWNNEVMKVAAAVDKTAPVEVAFGMASKRSIQQAIDGLAARGVTEIVAVPLFISSHSSVITSTEYLLGKRKQAPSELAAFARMDHGSGSSGSHDSHGSTAPPIDPMTPVVSRIPIRMAPALGSHPVVADILLSRTTDISTEPANEVVVVVAHGPVSDDDNERWLADMKLLVDRMRAKSKFKRIEYLTVRDDAPEPIRSRAAAELRGIVQRAADERSRALVVPLLLSYGGIEEGVKKRLEGLDFTITGQALLPDERIADWVLGSVKNRLGAKIDTKSPD